MMYQIKCEQCNKKLTIPTLYIGFAEYSAEAHIMSTGHVVDVIEVK